MPSFLLVAGLRHGLLLLHPLVHHRADAQDFVLELLDARGRLREQRLRVGGAGPDVAFERLDLGDPALDDLVDGHAERLERRLDDLLSDRRRRLARAGWPAIPAPARPAPVCSSSMPAASNTALKSTWPPSAAGGAFTKTCGISPAGSPLGSPPASARSAATPSSSSDTTNHPSTVAPQPFLSFMSARSGAPGAAPRRISGQSMA